jgi:hypothetical protein
MTTDVSSRPLRASATGSVIDYDIQILAQSPGVDPRRALRAVCDDSAWNEPAWRHRPQLRNRHAVAGDDNRLSGLHFPQDRPGVVAELALSDHPGHGEAL